jgi:hypothetical protein
MALPVTSGLLAHYEPDSIGDDGFGSVIEWLDTSGNGYDLFSMGASTAAIGSYAAVDTVSGGLQSNTGLPLANAASVTVFVVVTGGSSGQWGAIVHHGNRDSDWSIEQSGFQAADDFHFQSVNDNNFGELPLTTGQSYILGARMDASDRYFESTQAGNTFSTNATGNSTSAGSKTLWVGQSENGEMSRAVIGEIIYYDRALTNGEMDDVRTYLASVWGI